MQVNLKVSTFSSQIEKNLIQKIRIILSAVRQKEKNNHSVDDDDCFWCIILHAFSVS